MSESKFTPRAQSVLRLSHEAAEELGHSYVGTEHLLLGVLREEAGGACRVLGELGLDQYRAVTDLLAEYQIPMVMDVDFGHLPPMMPLMCGAAGKVRVKGNDIEIQYLKK